MLVSRDIHLLVRAFVTYVRPVVEYNTVIWSPFNKCDIERVEKVQRRFTKWLPGLKDLTYSQRLKVIDLESLELRRLYMLTLLCVTKLYLDLSLIHI